MSAEQSTTSLLTVSICTFNRKAELIRCLDSLLPQARELGVGVLVIDNASTDGTADLFTPCSDYADVRLVREPSIGLSHARNRAISECSTTYLYYLDDDAKVPGGWLDAVVRGIRRWNAEAVGGPYRPYYLSAKPEWFDDRYGSAMLDRLEGPIRNDQQLSGGNLGFRLEVLQRIGGFPDFLGMKGTAMGVGEETYVLNRIREVYSAARLVFLPETCILHLVPEAKYHLRYWVARSWRQGSSARRIDGASTLGVPALLRGFLSCGWLGIWMITVAPFRHRTWREAFFIRGLPCVHFLGYLGALCRRVPHSPNRA